MLVNYQKHIFLMVYFLCGMLLSCNPVVIKHPYTLNAEYQKTNLANRKVVVIFPTEKNIFIQNKDDVADDLGGANAKPESRIQKFYFPWFFENIKALASSDSFFLLDNYRPGLSADSLALKDTVLKTGDLGAALHYRLPDKAVLSAHGLDSSVLFIIESIEFKRNNFQMEYSWDVKSRKPANLMVSTNIVIWDYKNNMPVFYGPLSVKVEFSFSMGRSHWEESARLLAKKIVKTVQCL